MKGIEDVPVAPVKVEIKGSCRGQFSAEAFAQNLDRGRISSSHETDRARTVVQAAYQSLNGRR